MTTISVTVEPDEIPGSFVADYFEKRKGGAKLTRTETVTVRLDPKLRYLAELAARRQRRTVSSYIEWAIEDSLDRIQLSGGYDQQTLTSEVSELWDVDEADRFAKLAFRHPDLLTHEEQIRWKLIRENGALWKGRYPPSTKRWTWDIDESSLIFERLRQFWHVFCAVAEGSESKDALPSWARVQALALPGTPQSIEKPEKKTGFEDMDDDIPF